MKNVASKTENNGKMPCLEVRNDEQVAALCFRGKGNKRRILLVTSRDSGRWIIPKGWPIDGLDGPGSAAQEAWEEAGVKPARIRKRPAGMYHYRKRLDDGQKIPVETTVYRIKVERLADSFPEAQERIRKWVTPKEAITMVAEPSLKELLRAF